MKKLKVVWVCCFSNPEVRSHLKLGLDPIEHFRRKLLHKERFETIVQNDVALWDTRGINEFKKFDDVELHVISAASYLKYSPQEFEADGIHYYFYKDDADLLWHKMRKTIDKTYLFQHKKANRYINRTIDRIQPDVIHLIGAENMYSSFVLERPKGIPIIVYLQTLVSEPGFLEGYFMKEKSHKYVSDLESNVIRRCEYIGTESDTFKKYIIEHIDHKANILYMNVATNLPIQDEETTKEYDFVYFAHGIKKACDLAIEAFAVAVKKHPNLTLDIVGKYDEDFKQQMDSRIKELGITNNVTFEGLFPTHEDAVKQVKKAKFALLPFKVDYNPTTIPEAMSLGIPVVSTRTDGIKALYKDEYNILLSDIGDHDGLAKNMLRLVEDETLAKKIKDNAIMELKRDGNTERMKNWVEIYKTIAQKDNAKLL